MAPRSGAALLRAVLFVAGPALAEVAITSAGIEVPLLESASTRGLFSARVEVGTPPQALELLVRSASAELWVPQANGSAAAGFEESKSTTLKRPGAQPKYTEWLNFSDALSVRGHVVLDKVRLASTACEAVPMFVGLNVSGGGGNASGRAAQGSLGLVHPRGIGEETTASRERAATLSIFSRPKEEEEVKFPDGFLQTFWHQHPEVPRTLRLELGGASPHLALGAALLEGPPGDEAARRLSDTFTSRSPLWYAPVRAVGLSFGRQDRALRWNQDYNSNPGAFLGTPGLLDTSSSAIRVRTTTYESMLLAFPGDCKKDDEAGGTSCSCSESDDLGETFPYISISLESASTTRFFGLDSGDDVIVCMPPASYVSYNAKSRRCEVAVADDGERSAYSESLVLGAPFFRSVAVLLDYDRSFIRLGAPLEAGAAVRPSGRRLAEEAGGAAQCPCADPKNWWSTGHRLSWRRVALVLAVAAALAAYVYVAHSPSQAAVFLRTQGERLCGSSHRLGGGGGVPAQSSSLADAAGGRPDRPFISGDAGQARD
ncbi:unnamed protein product [Prorocentrum cordatum]|uniref:Peptidase A1 domain-containing protein n=1 Tax=Prorocentrum cordatum TaxID=2364126 RepID=A0ABN9XSX7_9DINO|nr:unnamed protein product [Polarella glacialis]